MTIQNTKDFWSGILFACLGLFFLVSIQELPMGSAARMGPAFFPIVLSCIMMGLGVLVALRGVLIRPINGPERIGRVNWRAFLLIHGSVLVFSLLLVPCGLMIALAAMIILSALADRTARWKEIIACIIVLDAIAWVVFVYIGGMYIPVLPQFL